MNFALRERNDNVVEITTTDAKTPSDTATSNTCLPSPPSSDNDKAQTTTDPRKYKEQYVQRLQDKFAAQTNKVKAMYEQSHNHVGIVGDNVRNLLTNPNTIVKVFGYVFIGIVIIFVYPLLLIAIAGMASAVSRPYLNVHVIQDFFKMMVLILICSYALTYFKLF